MNLNICDTGNPNNSLLILSTDISYTDLYTACAIFISKHCNSSYDKSAIIL